MNDENTLRREAELLARAALHVRAEDRSELLDDCCGADQSLRCETERLLRDIHEANATPQPFDAFLRGDEAAPSDGSTYGYMPGTRVGAYVLVRRLGEGASGVVFEAMGPGGRVAMKILRRSRLDPRQQRKFEREIALLRELQHPGIAAYLDEGPADQGTSRSFVAVELVNGRPLTEHATERGLDDAARVLLIEQACTALGYAHGRGVIHRDLKPANMLVDPEGRVKIIDFGSAAVDPSILDFIQTSAGSAFVGTVAYAAPEQIGGRRVDERADVYALGVVLFELLTGTTPYRLKDGGLFDLVDAVRMQRTRRLAELRPTISPDLEAVVNHALERNPDRRYRTCAQLADDLRRFRERRPVSVRGPGIKDLLRREIQRRPVVAAAMLTVFAISVAASFIILDLQRQRNEERLQSAMCAETAYSALPGYIREVAAARDAGLTVAAQLRMLKGIEPLLALFRDPPPEERSVIRILAAAILLRGECLQEASETIGAETAYRESAAYYDRLAARPDAPQEDVLDAAVLLVKRGEVARDRGDEARCEALFLDVLRRNEAEAARRPTARALDDLAWSYERCATLELRIHGNWKEAERLFDRMRVTADRLGKLEPGRISGLRARYLARHHLALLAEATLDDALDRKLIAEAGPLLTELLGREPDRPDNLEHAISLERSRVRLAATSRPSGVAGAADAPGDLERRVLRSLDAMYERAVRAEPNEPIRSRAIRLLFQLAAVAELRRDGTCAQELRSKGLALVDSSPPTLRGAPSETEQDVFALLARLRPDWAHEAATGGIRTSLDDPLDRDADGSRSAFVIPLICHDPLAATRSDLRRALDNLVCAFDAARFRDPGRIATLINAAEIAGRTDVMRRAAIVGLQTIPERSSPLRTRFERVLQQ